MKSNPFALIIDKITRLRSLQRLNFCTELHSIAFHTDSPKQVIWARKYLEPYYSININSNESVHTFLFSITNDTVHSSICDLLVSYSGNLIGMYRGEEITEYNISRNLRIQETKGRGSYIIIDSKKNLYILIMQCSDPQILQEPCRIIREVMTRHYEKDNALMFHAGAVEKNGVGILICGAKGAGKTTTVLGLTLRKGYRYISNDRILLSINNNNQDEFIIKGIPFAAAVRLGTAFYYKQIHPFLNQKKTITHISENKKLNVYKTSLFDYMNSLTNLERWLVKDYIELLPMEIAEVANTQVNSTAPLNIVVFPVISPERKIPLIRKVDLKYIQEVLLRECFTFKEDSYPDRFGIAKQKDRDIQKNVKELARKIFMNCVCVEIEYSHFEEDYFVLEDYFKAT